MTIRPISQPLLSRSWIAISLVLGLLAFCAAAFLITDTTLRSTLFGGLIASAGAAIAFYFSSSAADKTRADILKAVAISQGALPAAAPTVTGISPTTGAAGGGDTVTVTGTGFTGATAVNFGSIAATNLNVVSETQLTVTSPAPSASGAVDVTGDHARRDIRDLYRGTNPPTAAPQDKPPQKDGHSTSWVPQTPKACRVAGLLEKPRVSGMPPIEFALWLRNCRTMKVGYGH